MKKTSGATICPCDCFISTTTRRRILRWRVNSIWWCMGAGDVAFDVSCWSALRQWLHFRSFARVAIQFFLSVNQFQFLSPILFNTTSAVEASHSGFKFFLWIQCQVNLVASYFMLPTHSLHSFQGFHSCQHWSEQWLRWSLWVQPSLWFRGRLYSNAPDKHCSWIPVTTNSIWTEKNYPMKRFRACIQAWTKV